jgi:predicted RND superfamily exporter protein
MNRSSPIDRLTAFSLGHPWKVLLVCLALATLGGWLASKLTIRSSFEELLPSDVPSVAHIKDLVRRVGGDGTVLVNVECLDGPKDLARAEALALELADDYRRLGPGVIRSVEVNMRPFERWYADHWPLFIDLADLEKARDRLREEIARAKASMLSLGIDEDLGEEPSTRDVPFLDPSQPTPRQQVSQRFARYHDGFMVHPDGRSVTILVRPTGTALGVGEARALLHRMRGVAENHRAEIDASHLRVGFAGTFAVFLAEYAAIVRGVASAFLLCVSLVLLSLLLFYREARSVVVLGIAILVGVAVTFGLTRLAIGYLNTQTAFLGAIVVGNGINYGLIYLARLGQLRRRGTPLEPACFEAARAAWRATLLASVATSVSFGTLVVAANRGFRHFGLIGGIGMLLCWVATFVMVPALLRLMERVRPLRPGRAPREAAEAPRWLRRCFGRPRLVAAAFAVATAAAAALFVHHLPSAMQQNLESLTNDIRDNPELMRDKRRADESLGQSIQGAIALLPSREDADRFCDVIRERQRQPRWQKLIESCETLSSVVPAHQQEKLRVIDDIRRRLSDAVVSRLPPGRAALAREIRSELAAQHELRVGDAPSALVDRFRERDGTIGRIAFIRAQPDAAFELAPNLRRFVAGVRDVRVGEKSYDAAGETIVFADLLGNVEREGPLTTVVSFLGVCLLVLVFFRNVRQSAQVLTSLTVGVVLMSGAAALMGLQINFVNFIVYPITFGIAVDYGANVAARIGQRRDVLGSLAEVGPAVALCSWTSMIGYGSLFLSTNQALRSFGSYAMVGEFTTIVTALVLLPALRLSSPAHAVTGGAGGPRGGSDESPESEPWARPRAQRRR